MTWSSLANSDIRNQYTVTVRNKYGTLQAISKKHSLNDEYENFVTAYLEAATGRIPTKLRAKCRVPWKSIIEKNEIT